MSTPITTTYDSDILCDIFVYASAEQNVAVGGYDIYVNGQRSESIIMSLSNGKMTEGVAYLHILMRAFSKALDHVGKQTVFQSDPRKEILSKRTSPRPSNLRSLKAKNTFRFRIPNNDILRLVRDHRGYSSIDEEKLMRVFFARMLEIERTQTPYRNLKVNTVYEFHTAKDAEVALLAEHVNIHLQKKIIEQPRPKNG